MGRRLLWMTGIRLVVASLLLGGTIGLSEGPLNSFTPRLLILAIGLTYAASAGFALAIHRNQRLLTTSAVQVLWDLLLTTALIYVTGGIASVFTFLFGVTILMTSILVGPRATQVTAVTAILLLTTIGVSLANGWLPHPPDQTESGYLLSTGALSLSLMTNIVGLVLVTVLATGLADRIRRTRGRLVAAEKSARSIARLHEDIVRSLSSGVLTLDREGRILTINPAGAHMFGGTPEELFETPFRNLMPDPPTDPSDRPESLGLRVDGTHFPLGFSRNPLTDADDKIQGELVCFQDLTEVRRLKANVERAETLATLGRLAAGLAHEIRNPLSSISGSVELVREGTELPEADRRLLGIVVSEVERLNDLVTTMLQVGRPVRPTPASCELASIAREVVEIARQEPAHRQIEIELDVPSEPVHAEVDPQQIRQVIWNLVKNALQASENPGRVTVSLRLASAEQVELTVADEGKGLPEGSGGRLFDTFFSGRQHGVGLGLALVKQIVDSHQGTIRAENREPKGARFSVELPVSQPPAT